MPVKLFNMEENLKVDKDYMEAIPILLWTGLKNWSNVSNV